MGLLCKHYSENTDQDKYDKVYLGNGLIILSSSLGLCVCFLKHNYYYFRDETLLCDHTPFWNTN